MVRFINNWTKTFVPDQTRLDGAFGEMALDQSTQQNLKNLAASGTKDSSQFSTMHCLRLAQFDPQFQTSQAFEQCQQRLKPAK